MTATKIQPGDDTHLTLLMTPHSLNFVTGADRAALLAYGRDVFAAARDSKCLAQIEEPAHPIAGYRISDPSDPTIKPWLSETPDDNGYTSEPLYAGAAPAAAAGPAREEIAALRAEHGITSTGRGIKEFEQVDAFVRAVLQRWGAAPALEAPAAPADDRADFEKWARQQSWIKDCQRYDDGRYGHCETEKAWATWQARAALAAAPQAPAAPSAMLIATRAALAETAKRPGELVPLPEGFKEEIRKFNLGEPSVITEMVHSAARCDRPPVGWTCSRSPGHDGPCAAAPAEPSGLPSGWVPCILTHDGQHPEEVAYGPQIMMDRLKKWLGRYFELLAQAAPAAPAVDAWLQPDDMAALQRFHETAEDDESYDIGKEAVARLCAFGCLQSHSFGRYSTTDFGDYLLGACASARTLPFATATERAAQAKEGGAAC